MQMTLCLFVCYVMVTLVAAGETVHSARERLKGSFNKVQNKISTNEAEIVENEKDIDENDKEIDENEKEIEKLKKVYAQLLNKMESIQYCEALDKSGEEFPKNAVSTSDRRAKGAKVRFECEEGFYQCGSNDAVATCQSDKTWGITGSIKCIGKTQVIANPKPNTYSFNCDLTVGSKVIVSGYPTRSSAFIIDLYRGDFLVMHASMRFWAHGDYRKIVLNDYLEGRGWGYEQRSSYFPFNVYKTFEISIERISGGYKAVELKTNTNLFTFKRNGNYAPEKIKLSDYAVYSEVKVMYQ